MEPQIRLTAEQRETMWREGIGETMLIERPSMADVSVTEGEYDADLPVTPVTSKKGGE